MFTVSIKSAKQLIEDVAIKMNEPVMLWGQPGVGKSEVMQQLARDYNAVLCDVRLSQYDSVDLRGIPVPDDGFTVWHAPSTLPFEGNEAFPDDGLTLLFLDEINAAAPAVSAVAYQLINDRRVGEHKLKDNVRIVAAGNRESDRGVTNRMPTPLANRFTHIEIAVDVDAWCEWAIKEQLPAIGIAFMQFRKPLLTTFDPTKPDKAFATPRTWVKALRYYSSNMREDIKQAAMAGAIGVGPSSEFWGFVHVWSEMPSIKEIEANPKTARLPEDAATQYAVTINVSGNMTAKNAGTFMHYLERMSPEFVVLAWQLGVMRDEGLYTSTAYPQFAKKYNTLFVD